MPHPSAMTEHQDGYSLIETLLAAFILAAGLTATAALFSHTIAVTAGNRQRATGTTLLYDKLEELKGTRIWSAGYFSEQLTITVTGQPSDFRRTWHIVAGTPMRATVTVFKKRNGSSPVYDEVAQATMLLGKSF